MTLLNLPLLCLALFSKVSYMIPLLRFFPKGVLPIVLSTISVNYHVKKPFYPYLYLYNQIDIGTHFWRFWKGELRVHVVVEYFHIIYNISNMLTLFLVNNCAWQGQSTCAFGILNGTNKMPNGRRNVVRVAQPKTSKKRNVPGPCKPERYLDVLGQNKTS